MSLVIERLSGGKVVGGSQRTCCVLEIKMREQTLVRWERKLEKKDVCRSKFS